MPDTDEDECCSEIDAPPISQCRKMQAIWKRLNWQFTLALIRTGMGASAIVN